jgi:hypothetical protein
VPDTEDIEYEEDWEEEGENELDEWEDELDEEVEDEASNEEPDLLEQGLREAEETRRRDIEFVRKEVASGRMSRSEGKLFLEHTQVDTKALRSEVEEFKKESNEQQQEIERQLASGEIGESKAMLLKNQLREQEKSLRWRLTLAAAAMTPSDLSAVAEECHNLHSDSVDSETKEMRMDIKEKMADMTPSQRKARIQRLYDEGTIDESQWSFLMTEFM